MPISSISSLPIIQQDECVSERISPAEWLIPFEPPAWLRNGHAQTLAGNYWRRQPFLVPAEA